MARSVVVSSLIGFLLLSPPAFGVIDGVENDDAFHDAQSSLYGMNWDHVYQLYKSDWSQPRDLSYVAVGYFRLLTALHEWTGIGDKFMVNGDEFEVTARRVLEPDTGQTLRPDLVLLEVKNNTNPLRPLPGFYQLHTGSFPLYNKQMVVVGTGYSGDAYTTWYEEDQSTGRLKRWGTNEHDDEGQEVLPGQYSTSCFRMGYRKTSSRPQECGLAEGDSGGGVFYKPSGQGTWMLAGISLYRDGTPSSGRDVYAAKIPDYAAWMNDVLSTDLLPGDVDLDGDVDANDYLQVKLSMGVESDQPWASWEDGDFGEDGYVDEGDLLAVETNFGYVSVPHPIMTPPAPAGGTGFVSVPEPASVVLLAFGALVTGFGRRRRVR